MEDSKEKQIENMAEEILQEYTNCYSEVDQECLEKMLRKLASNLAEFFADRLLAEGVIVPKVKIGDKLYAINASKTSVKEYIVTHLEIYESGVKIYGRPIYCHEEYWMCWSADLGNNDCVFLTREEAEKALERSENGKS